MNDDDSYQILISNYMPFLRYFLHRYGMLESNYWNLFDELQDATDFDQRRLELEDLKLGDNLSYYYSPFSITAFSKDKEIARIRVTDGGAIQQVAHIDNGSITMIDYYDDRGFLSSQKDSQQQTTIYFDTIGNWIFKELSDNTIAVNNKNPKILQESKYSNMNDLIARVLNEKLAESAFDDELVISLTDQNLEFVAHSAYVDQMTASFFAKRVAINSENQSTINDVVNNVKSVIVDTDDTQNKLQNLKIKTNNIFKISPYDTRFEFGASQSLKEETIFIDVRQNTEQEITNITNEVLQLIDEEQISKDDSDRDLRVLIRTTPADKTLINSTVQDTINDYFAEESALISKTLLDKGENNLDLDMQEEFSPRVLKVIELTRHIKVESFTTDDELYRVLNNTRIVVDLANSPDLFTQISAISTGIPQINIMKTEYVQQDKNGQIIQDIADLKPNLALYLNQLKYWIAAQAFSAEQIKKYSGISLKTYLLEIVGGTVDDRED